MELYEDNINQLLQARSEIDDELRRRKSQITIFFTDVVGSTTYFDRFGDTAGLLLVHRHDNLVMSAVEEFQGTVIKTIGDSVMAEFPDPALAVRAAMAIQERLTLHNWEVEDRERLQIRTGINYGTGFRRGNDLFGDAINLAARITKKGGPGQILISRSVYDALNGTEFRFRSLGRIGLEGKSGGEELYEVLWKDALTTPEPGEDPAQKTLRTQQHRASADVPEPLSSPDPQRYEVLAQLGVGGMGIVLKARDRETGEIVALKVLKTEIAAQPELIERFKNELRLARRITHRNVCRIYDFYRNADSSFFSMEYVEGESLRKVLDRFGALGVRSGTRIGRQICEGLREAHAQGIVHLDLKPENLMIDDSGNVKLMDFGLAHLVAEDSTVAAGTPSYMAPEQAEGLPVDQRSDIYALGLVLFELFTGFAPFTGDTPIAVALKHIQQVPVNPREIDKTLPDYIAEGILFCLEKDPAKRFQSIEEVQAAMFPESADTVAPSPRFRWADRRAAAGVLTAVVLMVAVVFVTYGRESNPDAAIQASASPVSDSEFAAFRMAELLNSTDAWNAYLHDYPAGELATAAHQRLARLEAPVEAKPEKTVNNAPAEPLKPKPEEPAKPKWSGFFDAAAIPSGVFLMGNDDGRGDESPRHQVRLNDFRLSRAEITNRQYVAFLDETGHQRPRAPGFAKNYLLDYPDLPVVNVSFDDVTDFCNWAAAKFGVTVRLPTEAEWEYAAQARRPNSLYPWGQESPMDWARYKGNAPAQEIPTVGANVFPANGYGLFNMNGNVWEWVSDYYSKDYYKIAPLREPTGPDTGTRHVLRGGSWGDDETQLTNSRRANRDSREFSDQVGFRVVIDPNRAPQTDHTNP